MKKIIGTVIITLIASYASAKTDSGTSDKRKPNQVTTNFGKKAPSKCLALIKNVEEQTKTASGYPDNDELFEKDVEKAYTQCRSETYSEGKAVLLSARKYCKTMNAGNSMAAWGYCFLKALKIIETSQELY